MLKIDLEQEVFMKLKLIHSLMDSTGKIAEIKRHHFYHKSKMKKIAQDLMILKRKSLSIHKMMAQLPKDPQLKRIKRGRISIFQDIHTKKKLRIKKQN